MELASLLLVFLLILFSISKIFGRNRLRPPGPPCVPFFGSLPFLDMSKGFLSWGLDPKVTKHPLAFVKLGGLQVNIINDFNLAMECNLH